ncbi:hypothetical protein Tco_1263293 [Tanacetum coccineum]
MTMAVSEHFFYTKPSIGQRFVFMLRKGTDFSKESVKKRWGKESANENSSKFIPRFNSSFVEFVQPCFCFSNSKEFMNVFMRIGFGSTIKLVSFDEGQMVTFAVSGMVIAEPGVGVTTRSAAHMGSSFIGS